jgi:hypothetical protein
MDVDEHQQQLSSNSLTLLTDIEITEETPLTDIHANEDEEEIIPCMIPETYDWNTSLINEVRISALKFSIFPMF